MIKRTITSIVALCVLVPVLFLADTLLLPVGLAVCAVLGCYEMFSCVGLKKKILLCAPVYAVALIFPLISRMISEKALMRFSICAMGVIIVYMLGVAVFSHSDVQVTDVGLAIGACIYIIAALMGLLYLHDSIEHGKHIYLLTFICAWTTDVFAYLTGRFFGKHKLIPAVSPKKTVEGAIGGIVFCVGATLLFGFIIETFFNPNGDISANYLVLAISGAVISVISQIGDLIMSLIKRHYGIKDYGKIFPGHGGILDRFDSVMAVSVILTFICTYFNLFT